MDTKIWIDTSDAENILYGVHELAEGMGLDIYGRTAEGITRTDGRFSAEDNAHDFILSYYTLTSGAFRLISGAMSIITRAIADGDLHVTPKESEEEVQT